MSTPKKTLNRLAAFLVLGTLSALGSTPASPAPLPQPPEGPLLKTPPEFSQWTVTFQYIQDVPQGEKSSIPLNPSLPRKVLVTKTKDIIHQEIVNVGGQNIDSWQIGQNMYIKLPDQDYWGVYDSSFRADNKGANPLFLPLPPSNFHDLDFVNTENFVSQTKFGGKTLLTFIPPGESKTSVPPKESSTSAMAPITMAQIDEATRLPLNHSIKGQEERTYAFLQPPSAMLQLPPALIQQFKRVEAHRAKYLGPMKGE